MCFALSFTEYFCVHTLINLHREDTNSEHHPALAGGEGQGAGSARFADTYKYRYQEGDSVILLPNDESDKWQC